jgi:uncharacterized protein YqeY
MSQDIRIALQAALKEAMINKDALRRDLIRQLNSALKQVEVDERRELSAEDVENIIQKEAKKRRESISEYGKAGRNDLVEKEQVDLAIIEEFLPKQLSVEEITAIVQEVIAEVGATSSADISKIMPPLMKRVKGIADGRLVNQIVKEQLG